MKDSKTNTRKKIIAVTGTPGTGKTTIAGKLAKKINGEIINLTQIINENKLYTGIDKSRDTKLVDVAELKKFVADLIKTKFKNSENIIIDGLMSHHMGATHIIVLRANPKVLKQRLKSRNYSKAKIRENLEAEFLGTILEETRQWCDNILELDATENINFNLILDWLKKGGRNIKEIDWTDDFCEVLENKFS